MKQKAEKKSKLSFRQTIQLAWKPYRRLYSYVRPYKWRFVCGLLLGFAFGIITSFFPIVIARVTSFIFNGAAPNPQALMHEAKLLNTGPKVNSILTVCLAIPLVMTARSLCSYGNSYLMNWVSNKVVTDIRVELFQKIVRHSMDFFNKMRAGVLMSRVTNDTRGMQMA